MQGFCNGKKMNRCEMMMLGNKPVQCIPSPIPVRLIQPHICRHTSRVYTYIYASTHPDPHGSAEHICGMPGRRRGTLAAMQVVPLYFWLSPQLQE
jgi:hypothetical protein